MSKKPDVAKDKAEIKHLIKDRDRSLEKGDMARAEKDISDAAGILMQDPKA